jgi:ABC-type transport system involved in multi-copper enzyme maturation permease subunit
MVFLPIVERELRLASRRKSTHRIRLWTTLAALLVSFFFILVNQFGRSIAPNMGPVLFSILTYYAFGLSLLAGVFLAADCISQEKREGTLGLLFLTDLKGYDVVLGKLITVGLSALYGLVAVLPVTALPLLLGGVTGAEYWRVSLALVNTLFFALATGILVSTYSSEANRAMGNTLGWLLFTVVILPIGGGLLSLTRLAPQWWYATSFSPFYPFAYGVQSLSMGAPGRYWTSLAASHLFAWFMVLLASWRLPRTWQDKPLRRQKTAPAAPQLSEAAYSTQYVRRARLLDQNPVLWLVASRSGMRWRVWALSLGSAAIVLSIILAGHEVWTLTVASIVFALLGFIFKILVAFEATRFFVEARRSGALELILSTPLTSREIIRGQWLALKRVFLWPLIVFVGAYLLLTAVQISNLPDYSGAGGPNITTNMNINGFIQAGRWPLVVIQSGALLYHIVKLAVDLIAIGWLGMWLSLSAKKTNLAAGMTILFAVILPSICVPFVFDVIFILWAWQKLRNEFRRTALPEYLDPFNRMTLLPVPNIPPVIGR